MLFKLSLRNIRRSIKDFYFFTLVLAVAIFYVFNSLESQTVMLNVSSRTHELIDLMNSVMPVMSVFVAIVLGFLIIYASRFLMKRRKKEFGIYMTLGMGKGQISRILLIETFVIGLVSLAVGIIAGVAISQLMSVFVANLFEADMTGFQFIFSPEAFGVTALLFAVIYIIVMVFSAISIGRTKLINLITSDKQGEKIKVRNLAVSIIMFLAAAITLTYAYLGVTANVEGITPEKLVIYIVSGIVGTFLLFWSISGLALRFFRRFKPLYFKKLNMFIFREVDSKVNTTVVSMSIISILLFLTIGIFSSAMSINDSLNTELETLVPADMQATKNLHHDDENNALTIDQAFAKMGFDPANTFSEYVTYYMYTMDSLTFRDTMGHFSLGPIGNLSPDELDDLLDTREEIVHLSEYNQLADIFGFNPIRLADDQYAISANADIAIDLRNEFLAKDPQINIAGVDLVPASRTVVDGFIRMSPNPTNIGVFIVPDHIDLSEHAVLQQLATNYLPTDEAEKTALDEKIMALFNDPISYRDFHIIGTTRTRFYESSVGLTAMTTYIGLYLGIVFLVASAALLGLKEISESSDNQQKYLTLRQLGVDQKVMNRTLLIQQLIFFGLPLVVASIHSIFGIAFANQILIVYAESNLLYPIIMTALLILAVYGGYFLITYFTSKRIVMDRE